MMDWRRIAYGTGCAFILYVLLWGACAIGETPGVIVMLVYLAMLGNRLGDQLLAAIDRDDA